MNQIGYIVYEWLRSLPFAKECGEQDAIYFATVRSLASIRLYDDQYMELTIRDRKTEQQLFYQQLELRNMKETKKLLSVFFYALGNPEVLPHEKNAWEGIRTDIEESSGGKNLSVSGKDREGENHRIRKNDSGGEEVRLSREKDDLQPLRILIGCTSGASSFVLANRMREIFRSAGSDIRIDAVSVEELESRQEEYDLVLLSPQIGYRYDDLNHKYGDKIRRINSLDFATMNAGRILTQIGA